MAEDRIYVGSRARILLPAVDVTPDGDVPLDPAGLALMVWRPDGTLLIEGVDYTQGEADGVPYIDFAAGQLDMAGVWRAQGDGGGYLSKPVTWRVYL